MAIDCSPTALEAAAKCLCLQEKKQIEVQTYLLLQIANTSGAGLPTDAKTLLARATAAGFAGLNEKQNRIVQTYLECQIAQISGV